MEGGLRTAWILEGASKGRQDADHKSGTMPPAAPMTAEMARALCTSPPPSRAGWPGTERPR